MPALLEMIRWLGLVLVLVSRYGDAEFISQSLELRCTLGRTPIRRCSRAGGDPGVRVCIGSADYSGRG